MTEEQLKALRNRLKSGEYDGAHIMQAWIAIDDLIELKQSKDKELKREVIAMHAMQAILSNSGGAIQSNPMSGTGWCNSDSDSVALLAIECADSLIKKLESNRK